MSNAHGSTIGSPKRIITGHNHTYRYFADNWIDGLGDIQPRGYYDENDTRYDGVCTTKEENVVCFCEYCGNVTRFNTHKTTEFQCSSCGAPLNVIIVEEDMSVITSKVFGIVDRIWKVWRISGVVIALIIAIGFIYASNYPEKFEKLITHVDPLPGNNIIQIDGAYKGQDRLYLSPLIEHCYSISAQPSDTTEIIMQWDGTGYYDDKNDYRACYDNEFSEWQYWYGPVSGNFSNYGWLKYDEIRGEWYVEVGDRAWVPLSDYGYDTDVLYYFH